MSWDRLLARLDPDPARARTEYARLRSALVRVFDWRGARWPEDAADETLARLAAKLEADDAIADVAAFAHGIARRVLLELSRSESRLVGLDGVEPAATDAPPEEEPIALALDACLGRLADDQRTLVLAYYSGGRGREKLDRRRELADAAGMTPGALRSRIQRLRDRLERCVRERLDPSERHGTRHDGTQDEGR